MGIPHNHETSKCRLFPPPCLHLLRISRQDFHPRRRGGWCCCPPSSEARRASIRSTCPCIRGGSRPPCTQGSGWTRLHLCQDRPPGQLQVGGGAQGWSTIWSIGNAIKSRIEVTRIQQEQMKNTSVKKRNINHRPVVYTHH